MGHSIFTVYERGDGWRRMVESVSVYCRRGMEYESQRCGWMGKHKSSCWWRGSEFDLGSWCEYWME
jgi:hypothetical protein